MITFLYGAFFFTGLFYWSRVIARCHGQAMVPLWFFWLASAATTGLFTMWKMGV